MIILAIILTIAVGTTAFLGLLWLDHNRETRLPTPTGPFATGRIAYDWIDAEDTDPLAPQPGTHREILVWIWYPAQAQPHQPAGDYLPAPWRTAVEQRRGGLITNLLTRNLSRVRAHSLPEPSVAPEQRSYPMVLMRAGLAALTAEYTSLAEDLASHGYVVVGFDAPYRSAVVVSDKRGVILRTAENDADLVGGSELQRVSNRLVQGWTADMRFALNRLEWLNASDPSGRFVGRLDLQRAGVFGHSLGGAVALQFCHEDARCKACIDIDGAPVGSVIHDGVEKPSMFLLSDHRSESASPESQQIEANIRSIQDRAPAGAKWKVTIRGATHFMFSDDGSMLKSPLVLRLMRFFGVLHIDGRRQVAVTAQCVRAFFDVYLKGAPASKLEALAQVPEIQLSK